VQGAAASNAPANPNQTPPAPQKAVTQVTISSARQLTVPSLIGLPVRKVIEAAAGAGLDVEVTGSGTARAQAPPAGTQVPPGTRIVVRCGR
jgi:cell division protein FtsI (penicillin-binding protein 3)